MISVPDNSFLFTSTSHYNLAFQYWILYWNLCQPLYYSLYYFSTGYYVEIYVSLCIISVNYFLLLYTEHSMTPLSQNPTIHILYMYLAEIASIMKL